MRDQAFYFGCHQQTGHYLFVRGMGRVPASDSQALSRFRNLIDGGFIPEESHQQGRAWLTHVGDWTFLAFADNSIDGRGKSHSTFVLSGRLSYSDMLAKTKVDWPEVWARFTFNVYPAEPEFELGHHLMQYPTCGECGMPPGTVSGPHCLRCGRTNGGG
jgi:hypothetical protein